MRRIISEKNGVTLFAENKLPFGDDLPLLCDSIDLLKKLKSKKIIDILKLYKEHPSTYLCAPYNIPENKLFKRGSGPIFFLLESEICVGFYASSLNSSVLVWQENLPLTFDILEKKFAYIINSGCLVSCQDMRFGDPQCANIIGKRIDRLTIYKTSEPRNLNYRNERGLLVTLDDETDFLISKGLQKKCDFTLMSDDKIKDSLKDFITTIEV
ncbi:hypothetical protein UNDKW_3668 [Undibacterium sp. KW1]|uniref:hypothetical protein n=1 Tax=Undibacterium sp. KW1 TaxID=2058624 RepID=UPI001331D613|nr:hypothetical protein [Undibacterium sp. KW1]BBB61941.1 hypothetical protein UNDKW_3668 [Undibacterium sp. KW1]